MGAASTLWLIIDALRVKRGERTVIRDLSLKLAAGEGLLLTGPNGAGKTTLVRAIAGLLTRESGSIRLDGSAEPEEVGASCHLVGHANAIKPALTVRENVAFWADFLGGPAGATDAALAAFGLSDLDDLPAAFLSAGQKRRLGLARLLAAPRPLWLLDEPTVSLDAASTKLLAGLVEKHLAAGGMAIAATHIPLGIAAMRELHLEPARAAA